MALTKKKKLTLLHYCIALLGSLIAISWGLLVGREIRAAVILDFSNFQATLTARTFPVRFWWGWNDFPGAIIINSIETLGSGQEVDITFNNETLTCYRKINGYYFTSARGLRVWPLSVLSLQTLRNEDVSYNDLNMIWGLYTSCTGHPQDVVGYITYTDNNAAPAGTVIFGVETDWATNTYIGDYSSWAFILENFSEPGGYFYDSDWGVGLVNSGSSASGDILNTFWNITVQWRVNISQVVDSTERTALKGNIGKKSIVYNSDEASNATIINTASKNAQKYCRGGNIISDMNDIASLWTSKVICFDDGTVWGIIAIDQIIAENLRNKDLIVRNKDVVIAASAFGKPLSLFIDKWNLLIDNGITPLDLTNFDSNGYATVAGVTKGIYLVGNFIVNGLVIGYDGGHLPVEAKTFIHGRLSSLNLPSSSYAKREQQVEKVLGTATLNEYISLQNVFTRQCSDVTWYWTTGVNNIVVWPAIPCNNTGDNHLFSSLIVIESNKVPTLLLNNN